MAATPRVLRQQTFATETTRGTVLPTVRRLYGMSHMGLTQPVIAPQEERNSFFPTYRTYLGLKASDFQYDGDFSFEDAQHWGAMAMKGLTAASSGGTGTAPNKTPYVWTFVPSASVDDLKTATFEWSDNTQAWKSAFCMLDRLTVSGSASANQGVRVSARYLAKERVTTSATTVADSTRTSLIGADTKIYVDAAGGTMGTTQLTGTIINWNFEINNGLSPLYYCDGSKNWGDLERAYKVVTCSFLMRFAASALTELSNWQALTERLVEIQLPGGLTPTQGTTFVAGTTYKVQFQLAGMWDAVTISETGPTVTAMFRFLPRYNSTLTSDMKWIVTTEGNDLVTA